MRFLKSTRGRDPAAVTAFPARLNSIVERGRDDIAGSVSLDEASAVEPVRRRAGRGFGEQLWMNVQAKLSDRSASYCRWLTFHYRREIVGRLGAKVKSSRPSAVDC